MKLGRYLVDAAPRIALGTTILFILCGCRSNVIVLDQSPAWVVDAEQRLARDPVFNLDEANDHESRPLWASQSTNKPSTQKEPSTSRTQPRDQEKPISTTRPSAARAPAKQPAGVSWGETKITVQVED